MALAMATTPPPLPTNNNQPFIHNSHSRLLHLLNESTNISHLKQIHAQFLRINPHSLFLYSRILHHSSLSDLHYATRLFRHFHNPNSFMWNTLIRAYARTTDRKHRAIELYREMITSAEENSALVPDNHTFPFVLKACAYLFSLCEGKQLHAHVFKLGFESDTHICNSLIHFYASCGCLDFARKVFDKMPDRSEVSWNVMIDSYARGGEFETALRVFVEMQNMHEPDGYTMQSVVTACAGLGALSMGLWAHAYVLKKLNMDGDVLINTCLVDMYCKCGFLEFAKQVFEGMPVRDVNSWNSLILGLAMHGRAKEALEYYARMTKIERLVPNSITFVSVLSACNHRGMVNEGLVYFDSMTNKYNIEPRLEHYGCLVDLFARAGRVEEAMKTVSEMPMKPDAVIWRILLDACCKQHASVELSEEMANKVFESEESAEDCSGAYVLLSKVYGSAKRWNDVGILRKLMSDKGVSKEPGCSLIEIDGVTHEFFAGDTTHPQSKDIYKFMSEIEEKLEAIGYLPDYSGATLVDEINEGKKNTMRLHSERLAIAFGLLRSRPGMVIRVFKNLRVCNDCHRVTKLISRIYNVEIIVRDRARFHHFKDGACSCKDYW